MCPILPYVPDFWMSTISGAILNSGVRRDSPNLVLGFGTVTVDKLLPALSWCHIFTWWFRPETVLILHINSAVHATH